MSRKQRPAWHDVLLGADDLHRDGLTEFTEWEISVAAWQRNPERFGMRGFENRFPDHKRVMMEIMCKKHLHKPATLGLVEKVRPNVYRLSPKGRAEVARLRGEGTSRFGRVLRLASHWLLAAYREDCEQPRKVEDAVKYLDGMTIKDARQEVFEALKWCNKQ